MFGNVGIGWRQVDAGSFEEEDSWRVFVFFYELWQTIANFTFFDGDGANETRHTNELSLLTAGSILVAIAIKLSLCGFSQGSYFARLPKILKTR